MSNKKFLVRLVPRIGLPPKPFKLLCYEYEITKSLDDCPIEHSHFIAEHCRLPGQIIELLLRYTKQVNRPIEVCAKELGLSFNDSWQEPTLSINNWLTNIPSLAKEINQEITDEAVLRKTNS